MRYYSYPITVEEAVLGLCHRYPDSCPNRSEALHQILVVLGSGYGWDSKGRILGCISCPREIASPMAKLAADDTPPVKHPYPWSSLCLLATMPANASKDWKAACAEIRDVLTKQGYRFEERFT